MIELEAVELSWPDGQGGRVPALRGIDLRVAAGEKLVVLGSNGGGKSSLLKLLNGLVPPERGHYRYDGQQVDAARLADRSFARRLRQETVLLFQHPEAMLFNPSVREEIAYGPRRLGWPDVEAQVEHWARELRLLPLLDKPPHALSGGEKQKVALAALLILRPRLILLDEPTASLDPRSSGWLVDFLFDHPATVLTSTHHLSMAAEFGSRCLVLGEDHRLLYDGPTEAALADLALLERANLAHRHRHRHGAHGPVHAHLHRHDHGHVPEG
ncbi:ABC transporter ATP-binding protein [Piscinibacter sakaiensis]|uniref:Nickel ECF transporter, ATPase component NikO n=1 Tax=Piscinibacter sakaiensis TaxID=1547922 RepID=A0A0K8P9I2_PISS1|nr:ABC transporter ATP-binding protein [Piscinibacter sakaiensis]GAP38840.1 nickel ECF transporter, ATPase component NikO [Piscinibacter sakaiensis]